MYRNYTYLHDYAPIPTRNPDPLLAKEDRRTLEARFTRACAAVRHAESHEPWIVFTSASVLMIRLLKLAAIAAVAAAKALARRFTHPRPGPQYWDQWPQSHPQ